LLTSRPHWAPTRLVLQRQFTSRRPVVAASVVAGAGLVLSASSPVRPGDRGGDAGDRREDEDGEQATDLVAAQRDQPVVAGSGSPFFASWVRVAAR